MSITEGMAVLNRREFTFGLLAGAAFLMLPRMADASAVSEAQNLVNTISQELTRLINSGKTGKALNRDFERVLATYADMTAIGASCLGQPWRGASNAQKSAYISAFQGYLAAKYGRQFGDFKGTQIKVTGGQDAGRAGVLVKTIAVRPGRENIAVDWQISDRSGKPRAVNLIIEGVSMLANERSEIGAMLDAQGGSIDALVAELKRRS